MDFNGDKKMSKLFEIVGKILGANPLKINDESSAATLSEWDSMNNLVIFSAIEKEFNVKFTMKEINSVKNLGAVKQLLMAKTGRSDF